MMRKLTALPFCALALSSCGGATGEAAQLVADPQTAYERGLECVRIGGRIAMTGGVAQQSLGDPADPEFETALKQRFEQAQAGSAKLYDWIYAAGDGLGKSRGEINNELKAIEPQIREEFEGQTYFSTEGALDDLDTLLAELNECPHKQGLANS